MLEPATPSEFASTGNDNDNLYVFGGAVLITFLAALVLGVVELRKKSPYPVYACYIAGLSLLVLSSTSTKNTRRLFTAEVFTSQEAASIIKATGNSHRLLLSIHCFKR